MQTFMPLPSIMGSLLCLDYRRLGKQRVEAMQILNVLEGKSSGWRSHPAVRMWRGHEDCLRLYLNSAILVWKGKGFRNTMLPRKVLWPVILPRNAMLPREALWPVILPPWFGDEDFHRSHQSNLVRKDPEHYGPLFPGVGPDLPYVWPVGS